MFCIWLYFLFTNTVFDSWRHPNFWNGAIWIPVRVVSIFEFPPIWTFVLDVFSVVPRPAFFRFVWRCRRARQFCKENIWQVFLRKLYAIAYGCNLPLMWWSNFCHADKHFSLDWVRWMDIPSLAKDTNKSLPRPNFCFANPSHKFLWYCLELSQDLEYNLWLKKLCYRRKSVNL